MEKIYLSLDTDSELMRPPFIIIGMHRSGTSVLTKVLEKSGIFMGVIKDPNYEAMHFLSINQQVMWKSGYDWYKPGLPPQEHWHAIPARELYREHFRLNGRLASLKQKLRNEDWGWKDPRNTFTLPMWLAKFPKAKVIALYREEEDIVKSLQNRNQIKGEVQVSELNDANYCRQLCQDYQKQASYYQEQLGENYLELQYEDLKKHDASAIHALESFTGKSISANLKRYFS